MVTIKIVALYLFDVSLNVEVAKENDERHHVHDQGVLHPEGEIAPRSDAVDAHNESSRELDLHSQTTVKLERN